MCFSHGRLSTGRGNKSHWTVLEANKSAGKRAVIGHFVFLGVPERSVYRILGNLERGEKLERKSGSGRPAVKLPVAVKKRLVRQSCDLFGVSVRRFAAKYDTSKSYVHKTLKEAWVKS